MSLRVAPHSGRAYAQGDCTPTALERGSHDLDATAVLCDGITLGAATLSAPGAFAQAIATAVTGDGPFYPDRLPLDTDNDLLIVNDGLTPAVGDITHFTGRLFAENGAPVRNAFIEIWQSDVNGSYIHTEGRNDGKIDANFQGYGRFLTDSDGRYYFRTIKPVPYTLQGQFRAPHIHVAVSKAGRRIMATQALVKGHEANTRDLITQRIRISGCSTRCSSSTGRCRARRSAS